MLAIFLLREDIANTDKHPYSEIFQAFAILTIEKEECNIVQHLWQK